MTKPVVALRHLILVHHNPKTNKEKQKKEKEKTNN